MQQQNKNSIPGVNLIPQVVKVPPPQYVGGSTNPPLFQVGGIKANGLPLPPQVGGFNPHAQPFIPLNKPQSTPSPPSQNLLECKENLTKEQKKVKDLTTEINKLVDENKILKDKETKIFTSGMFADFDLSGGNSQSHIENSAAEHKEKTIYLIEKMKNRGLKLVEIKERIKNTIKEQNIIKNHKSRLEEKLQKVNFIPGMSQAKKIKQDKLIEKIKFYENDLDEMDEHLETQTQIMDAITLKIDALKKTNICGKNDDQKTSDLVEEMKVKGLKLTEIKERIKNKKKEIARFLEHKRNLEKKLESIENTNDYQHKEKLSKKINFDIFEIERIKKDVTNQINKLNKNNSIIEKLKNADICGNANNKPLNSHLNSHFGNRGQICGPKRDKKGQIRYTREELIKKILKKNPTNHPKNLLSMKIEDMCNFLKMKISSPRPQNRGGCSPMQRNYAQSPSRREYVSPRNYAQSPGRREYLSPRNYAYSPQNQSRGGCSASPNRRNSYTAYSFN